MNEAFRKFSHQIANIVGSPMSFLVAISVIVLWFFSGPLFDYSNTWQLLINTGTTISTFLMVFLIQNSQNRDARTLGSHASSRSMAVCLFQHDSHLRTTRKNSDR